MTKTCAWICGVAIAVAFGGAGCERKARVSDQAAPVLAAPVLTPPLPAEPVSSMDHRSIQAIAEQIKAARKQRDMIKGNQMMSIFIAAWDPVGKKAEALRALLGSPDEETSGVIVYRIDNGYNGARWVFEKARDTVVGLEVQSIGE